MSRDNRSLGADFGPHMPQCTSDLEIALRTGLLSLDANVLLRFYRYSPAGRSAMLDVLRAAGDRVWVSHQAAVEFWRNRCAAIDSRAQATADLKAATEKCRSTFQSAINAWAKQTAVSTQVKDLVASKFIDAMSSVDDVVSDQAGGVDVVSYATDNDAVYLALNQLLTDCVGAPPSEDEREEMIQEGNRRAVAGEPPGFLDVEKIDNGEPDGASGDYLVWSQSVREAVDRDIPLVIVTADQKEDWWWRYKGVFLGPRSELVREFAKHSSRRLYMLLPEHLTEYAAALDVSVGQEATEDVARASQTPPWPREAILEMLRRLDREGAVQAAVIREAAANGGSIDRERVYELDGRPEDKTLRGFTKPASRIAEALRAEKLLPLGTAPALEPRYDTGVIALRFDVPSEFVELRLAEDI